MLNVSNRTLYRLINEGQLRAYRIGRVFRIRASDIEAFLQSVEIQPGDLDHLLPEIRAAGGAPRDGPVDEGPATGA